MNIEFADPTIREYAHGPLHFKNDGKPIDVAGLGMETQRVLLNAVAHTSSDGEPVKVFKVSAVNKALPESEASEYPEGFPSADVLMKAGLKHSDVIALPREDLVALKGIGEKTADAILNFNKEAE